MEAAQVPPSSPPPEGDGLPDDAGALRAAAEADDNLTVGEEKDALDYLLGATKRPQFDVPFQLDTDAGLKRLVFRVQGMDARRLEEIDASNRNGDGPFAKLDTTGFNSQVAAEAVLYISNPETGRQVSTEEFLGEASSPIMGWELRFKYQPGILDGLVSQIRDKAGYTADRVGTAQRVLVEAAGNS